MSAFCAPVRSPTFRRSAVLLGSGEYRKLGLQPHLRLHFLGRRPRERQRAVSQSWTDVEKLKSGCPALRRRPGGRGGSPYLAPGLGPANSEPRPRRALRPSRSPAASRRWPTLPPPVAADPRAQPVAESRVLPGSAPAGPAPAQPSMAPPSNTPPRLGPPPPLKAQAPARSLDCLLSCSPAVFAGSACAAKAEAERKPDG